jgi:hypothetical protein
MTAATPAIGVIHPVPVIPPVHTGPVCDLCQATIGDGYHVTITSSDTAEPGLRICADCLAANFPGSAVNRLSLITCTMRQPVNDPPVVVTPAPALGRGIGKPAPVVSASVAAIQRPAPLVTPPVVATATPAPVVTPTAVPVKGA